jgi:hypothetical protein
MRWSGYVMHMAGGETHIIQGLVGKPKDKKYSENLDIDGRIPLKWISRSRMGWCRPDIVA